MILTTGSAVRTVRGCPFKKSTHVLISEQVVSRAKCTANSTDVPMQLDILDVLHVQLGLSFSAVSLYVFTCTTEKPGSFFQAIDVLSVRAEQLAFVSNVLIKWCVGEGETTSVDCFSLEMKV